VDAITAAGTALATAATDDAQAVLLQQPLAINTALMSGVQMGQVVTFISPVIDAFAAPGTLTTLVPALGAGLRFAAINTRAVIVTRSGTITGAPSGKLGSNANHDNGSPTIGTASAAQMSLGNAGDSFTITTAALTGTTAILGAPDLASAEMYEQVSAATGPGAALTYRIVLSGFILAFP
jgi:hypothetical protein